MYSIALVQTRPVSRDSSLIYNVIYCRKAELWLLVGFLFFYTLFQNSTGISPEFRRSFARVSNWSTLTKGDSRNSAFPQQVNVKIPAREIPGRACRPFTWRARPAGPQYKREDLSTCRVRAPVFYGNHREEMEEHGFPRILTGMLFYTNTYRQV